MDNNADKKYSADDLLQGGDKIAEFLFGDPAGRRKIYYLAENSRLPVFRIGAVLCARRSVLQEWISKQERRERERPHLQHSAQLSRHSADVGAQAGKDAR